MFAVEENMMKIDPNTFLLHNVPHVPSPNFNQRPAGSDVDLLVVHCISLPPAQFGSGHINDYFRNQLDFDAHPFYQNLIDTRVSSHVLIERTGDITQYVAFDKRAWHAGVSSYDGRNECNDYSVGIELEGSIDTPYTDHQYTQLAELTILLMEQFSKLSLDRIVGHSDVAPGRKDDPGPHFDWELLRNLIKEGL